MVNGFEFKAAVRSDLAIGKDLAEALQIQLWSVHGSVIVLF